MHFKIYFHLRKKEKCALFKYTNQGPTQDTLRDKNKHFYSIGHNVCLPYTHGIKYYTRPYKCFQSSCSRSLLSSDQLISLVGFFRNIAIV